MATVLWLVAWSNDGLQRFQKTRSSCLLPVWCRITCGEQCLEARLEELNALYAHMHVYVLAGGLSVDTRISMVH